MPCTRAGAAVPAGSLGSALGRLGHALHPQVLDCDPAVVLGEVGGELVDEVLPAACLPRRKPADLADGLAQPVRVAATVVLLGLAQLAGFTALQPQQASSLSGSERRRHQARFLLIGNERRAGYSEVHPTARQA